MRTFTDLKTTVKGDYGEHLVDIYLYNKGYQVFCPVLNKSHHVDRICLDSHGKVVCYTEIKTKSKRKYYQDTGMDLADHYHYLQIQRDTGIPIVIYFVDEENGIIRGNYFNKLIKPYKDDRNTYPFIDPSHDGQKVDIIYYPLANMRVATGISDADCEILKKRTTKNKKYLKS